MFRYIITITGLLLAGCAAYFSVTGLSQLFVGGGVVITIMASILEASKILCVSVLERYWLRLSKLLKTYLISAVAVLMIITSAGIYGLLANGYQQTFTELEKQELFIDDINNKQELLKESIVRLENSKDNLVSEKKQLNQLRGGQQIQYTNSNGELVTTTRDLSKEEKDININRIKTIDEKLGNLDSKVLMLRDSVTSLQYNLMDMKMNDELGGEIGPLIYISNLTDKSMDSIVNYLIMLIIFIFDPLAVTLIIVANKLRDDDKKIEKTKTPVKDKEVDKVPNIDKNEDNKKELNNKKSKAKEYIQKHKNNDRNFSVKIPSRDGG